MGFDHAIGPTVEFSYPPSLNEMGIKATLGEVLPFFALPDGAHAVSSSSRNVGIQKLIVF